MVSDGKRHGDLTWKEEALWRREREESMLISMKSQGEWITKLQAQLDAAIATAREEQREETWNQAIQIATDYDDLSAKEFDEKYGVPASANQGISEVMEVAKAGNVGYHRDDLCAVNPLLKEEDQESGKQEEGTAAPSVVILKDNLLSVGASNGMDVVVSGSLLVIREPHFQQDAKVAVLTHPQAHAVIRALVAVHGNPPSSEIANYCHSDNDGECEWEDCPQLRDGEPSATGRHCPLDTTDPER